MKFKIGLILALGIASALGAYFGRARSSAQATHVFINETSDHRFDESIQGSILASHARTGVQNAVVITDRIPAAKLEEGAADLVRELDLGRSTRGRTILYLFSPAQNALKIEVGYALEGVLPDAIVHGFEMAAKTFTYSERYQDFWAELINTLNIAIAEREAGGGQRPSYDFSKFRFVSGGAGIASRLYDVTPERLATEFAKMPSADAGTYAPDANVRESLTRYLRSLRAGLGDDALGVLSAESRVFRNVTPLTSYQLQRNADMYEAAGVDEIVTDDPYAFVFFTPKHPVLPLVFKRTDGLWRVEEPLSWSLFNRFEDSSQVFLKFPLTLRTEAARASLRRRFPNALYARTPVDLPNLARGDARAQWFFRFYWIDRVAKDLADKPLGDVDLDTLWLALDAANGLGQYSQFLKVMAELVKRHPDDRALARNYEFYKRTYVFTGPQWRLAR